MFWTDIARFLQYFRNLSNSYINIFAILQDFNLIFSKYSFNIIVLCGIEMVWSELMGKNRIYLKWRDLLSFRLNVTTRPPTHYSSFIFLFFSLSLSLSISLLTTPAFLSVFLSTRLAHAVHNDKRPWYDDVEDNPLARIRWKSWHTAYSHRVIKELEKLFTLLAQLDYTINLSKSLNCPA